MPTGWRPNDVVQSHPMKKVKNPFEKKKYKHEYSSFLKIYATFQFVGITIMLLYFLSNFEDFKTPFRIALVAILFLSIFSYTSVMDCFKWAGIFDCFRALIGIFFLILPSHLFLWEFHLIFALFLSFYFGISLITSFWIAKTSPDRKLALT